MLLRRKLHQFYYISLFLSLVFFAISIITPFAKAYALAYPPSTASRLLYTFPEGKMVIYDIDNSFALVKSVSLPTKGVRGVAASPATGMLYLSYGNADGTGGSLLKYDLVSQTQVWIKNYTFGVDSFAITPDGQTIYMPDGEFSNSPYWYVLSGNDGSIKTKISAGNGPHNTIVSLSGKRVYLNGVGTPYLKMFDTQTNQYLSSIGPLKSGGRPFTINGSETLSFTTATNFLGFQVSNIATGNVLFTVPVSGFSGNNAEVPSHGITLSPDEKEIYVIDGVNNYVHVYDVTGLPSSTPIKKASIKLSQQIIGDVEQGCTYDCDKVGWVLHSRNGRYVFVGDSGDVIDTSTRSIVKNIDTLSNTRKFLEIDWQNGRPSFTTTRSGLGYVTQQPSGQSVTSYTLINADTNQPISTLSNNTTINLATLPTRNVNIRANTNPSSVGSVVFGFDGNTNYRTENSSPYALASDTDGDYLAWTPTTGTHTLTATPFSASNASGTKGTPLSITFTVTDQQSSLSIASFILINADTNEPISSYDPLPNNATISLSSLPTRNLNIRAYVNPKYVGSVGFGLDGNASYNTENNFPYALASDNNGDYLPWTPYIGTHTITATPYEEENKSGTAGSSLSITVNFTN